MAGTGRRRVKMTKAAKGRLLGMKTTREVREESMEVCYNIADMARDVLGLLSLGRDQEAEHKLKGIYYMAQNHAEKMEDA